MTPIERRRALIAALRAPLALEWDFGVTYEETACGSRGCAIGVAHLLWPDEISKYTSYEDIATFFGMRRVDALQLFYSNPYGVNRELVTPEMVAAALEAM